MKAAVALGVIGSEKARKILNEALNDKNEELGNLQLLHSQILLYNRYEKK